MAVPCLIRAMNYIHSAQVAPITVKWNALTPLRRNQIFIWLLCCQPEAIRKCPAAETWFEVIVLIWLIRIPGQNVLLANQPSAESLAAKSYLRCTGLCMSLWLLWFGIVNFTFGLELMIRLNSKLPHSDHCLVVWHMWGSGQSSKEGLKRLASGRVMNETGGPVGKDRKRGFHFLHSSLCP